MVTLLTMRISTARSKGRSVGVERLVMVPKMTQQTAELPKVEAPSLMALPKTVELKEVKLKQGLQSLMAVPLSQATPGLIWFLMEVTLLKYPRLIP
jgi:hypothetical protein